MKAVLIGEGDRYDSLLHLLSRHDNVCGWSYKRGVAVPKELTSITHKQLSETPLVFLCVPMGSLRKVARKIGDAMDGRHAVVHSIHSLEASSLSVASQILIEELPTRRIGFLTGPMRSKDVANQRPSSGLLASRFDEIHGVVEDLLVRDTFRVYRSRDLRGAEYAASYERVIAMAAGIGYAMKLGESVAATLFARGTAEIARFVENRGLDPRTTFGLSGSANLFIDASAPGSVDYQIGIACMSSAKFDAKALHKTYGTPFVELTKLIEALQKLSREDRQTSHILEACFRIVKSKQSPRDAVMHLMSLPTLNE